MTAPARTARGSLAIAMLIFGSIGLFVRRITLPAGVIALVRGVVGSLFLIAACVLTGRRMSWRAVRTNLPVLLLSGAAVGANWIFLFEAYRHTTVSVATLSYYCAPVFVILLSPLVLKERLTAGRLICALGAVGGMAMAADVFRMNAGGFGDLLGVGLGLAAAVLYACVMMMNKFLKGLSGIESTAVQLITASTVLLPYTLVSERTSAMNVGVREAVLLLVVGIVHTGFAYFLYFSSMQKLPGQTVAVMSYIDPVTAILLSSILLGEHMSLWQGVGAALVLGMTLAGSGERKRA